MNASTDDCRHQYVNLGVAARPAGRFRPPVTVNRKIATIIVAMRDAFMKIPLWVCVALTLASVPDLVGQERPLAKGGGDETGQYEVVANWPKPLPNHEGWVPGPIVAVFAESADRVFFVQRGEMPAPKGRGENSCLFTGRLAGRPAMPISRTLRYAASTS